MSAWMIDKDSMDQLQLALLRKNLDSRILATGPAGSGKSILALQLAKKIAETKPESSINLIVFTNILRDFINAGLEELGIAETVAVTAHEWGKQGKPITDYLIVDEVQDFHLQGDHKWGTHEDFRSLTIENFANSSKNGLILFGDIAQRLYDSQWDLPDLLKMVDIKPSGYVRLANNYRTPQAIAAVASVLSPSSELKECCMNEDNSAEVSAIQCENDDEKADCIATIINNQGLNDVGILVPEKEHGRTMFKLLKDRGINCEAYLKGDWKRHIRDIYTIDFRTPNPKILTYHSAKGVQFNTIFIPYGEYKPKRPEHLYVACTRSQEQLFILHSKPLCTILHNITPDTLPRMIWGN